MSLLDQVVMEKLQSCQTGQEARARDQTGDRVEWQAGCVTELPARPNGDLPEAM